MGEGEGGRRLREPLARRGVDKGVLVLIWSPLPFIPSHEGRGVSMSDSYNVLETNS